MRPVACGAKVTIISHFVPGASTRGHWFATVKGAGGGSTLSINTATARFDFLLVTVRCLTRVAPSFTLPKFRRCGLIVIRSATAVGVAVGVAVFVAVGVAVTVGEAVRVALAVADTVGDGVGVIAAVAVAVGLGVGVGVGSG